MGEPDKQLAKQDDGTPGPDVDLSQLELELNIPQTLRTEFNFLKFPFFDLSKDSQRKRIKIEERSDTTEGKFHILWLVTRDVDGQFPGDFEKRLHRAIEQVVNVTPKPVNNPLRLGSLRYIASLMGINADSGKNREDIQKAFKNIVKASIEAEGTYQLKEGKSRKYIKDTFHLYDRVIFKGEELPDNSVAECVYLMLGSWYLHNINNQYVVPLDWRFYNQLAGSITTRMYEFLCIHFYTAIERGYQYHQVSYSEICNYFPLTPQSPRWKARGQLKQAHDILTKAGYFAKVDWLATAQADDWLLRYWIGPRAKEEYERNKKEIRQFGATMSRPVPIPERRRRRILKESNTASASLETNNGPLHREMVTVWGFSHKVTEGLLKRQSEARIREVLQWASWAKSHNPALIAKNPAGWIRKALEEDWQAPAGYEPEEEIKARQEKREQLAAGHKQQIEEQFREDEWKNWYSSTPAQRVMGELWAWIARYKLEHDGKEPSAEEVGDKEKELIAKLPSNVKRQQQIFGCVRYPEQV